MTHVCNSCRCRYAGFWRRVLAHVVDLIAIVIFLYAVAILLLVAIWLLPGSSETISMTPSLEKTVDAAAEITAYVVGTGFWLLYRAAFESSPLQATIGKLALSIKVTDVAGQRISFGRALVRSFATLISDATFLIGYLMVAFTPRKRALHDLVAGCLVVKHDDVAACAHADRATMVPARA
jgi:uncharacterized RDD family membrane protein YckC